jgi:hypothetical protein
MKKKLCETVKGEVWELNFGKHCQAGIDVDSSGFDS